MTLAASYDVGDSYRLVYTLTDAAGVPTNASVVVTVTKPDGTADSAALTNPSTGTYIAAGGCTQVGTWLYTFTATGALTDSEDGSFYVNPNARADLYATVPELREHLGDTGGTLPSGQLEAKIRAASRWVDKYTGRKFWLDPAVTVRRYTPKSAWEAWVDDIGTTTGLVIQTDTGGNGAYATTWATSDYTLEPLDADQAGGAFAWWKICTTGSQWFPTWGRSPTLKVTARHGWSQIPDEVREATLLRAVALWRRKDAPFGIAGVSDFGPLRITRTDPDVLDLLSAFASPAVA